jgi:hypothetical protein|tara:strand:- start:531 stop:722 length:192 start_codon:yes stop_codon:yes gene_type:complete
MSITNNQSGYDEISEQQENADAIAEFLKNGGTVTKIEAGAITDPDDIVYKFKRSRGPRAKKAK